MWTLTLGHFTDTYTYISHHTWVDPHHTQEKQKWATYAVELLELWSKWQRKPGLLIFTALFPCLKVFATHIKRMHASTYRRPRSPVPKYYMEIDLHSLVYLQINLLDQFISTSLTITCSHWASFRCAVNPDCSARKSACPFVVYEDLTANSSLPGVGYQCSL